MTVRTRFAPSPTGFLHIGGLRTALFNWLFARKHGGQFVLRIEDTDRERLVPEATGQIIESLRWTALNYDEGPDVGGPYGPYVQSERLAIYRKHADMLTASGAAYHCFCTPKRLRAVRDEQTERKQPPRYDRHCRALSTDDVKRRLDAGTPHVIRLKLPEQGVVVVDDLVRGRVEFDFAILDDSVLLKSDGYPTYHLAVVVDDHAMKISHVLRAEEWLPSTPKHLFLYDAFGWERPAFAHLSVLLSPGGGKLSKRDGATSVLEYRDLGYLPEALINFLALLGWNPKTDQEWFSRDELIKAFSLDGIQKAGAVFDRKKLDHMNGRAIRGLPPSELLARAGERVKPLVDAFGERAPDAVALAQDRMVTLNDLSGLTTFLVALPDYDPKLLVPKKGSHDKTISILDWMDKYFATLVGEQMSQTELSTQLQAEIQKNGGTNAEALWPLRVALAGQKNSPGVFEIAAVLGVQEVRRRIKVAAQKLGNGKLKMENAK